MTGTFLLPNCENWNVMVSGFILINLISELSCALIRSLMSTVLIVYSSISLRSRSELTLIAMGKKEVPML